MDQTIHSKLNCWMISSEVSIISLPSPLNVQCMLPNPWKNASQGHNNNTDKPQLIWLSTSHFLRKRDMQAVRSIQAILQSSDVVNNLGVYLDSELVKDRQVSKQCQICYFPDSSAGFFQKNISGRCIYSADIRLSRIQREFQHIRLRKSLFG